MSRMLLKAEALSCERDRRRLFAGLNVEVAAGDYLELTGPNGSGKSTLLRCLAGLFADYEGQVEAAPFLYLGHKAAVSQLLTPREQLEWFARLTATRLDGTEALERVGLAGYEDVRAQQLSAGQQRRVALARLFMSERPLWLLDEPLTALDTQGQLLVAELIDGHRAGGGGVVCATHQSLALEGVRSLELGAEAAA